MTEENGTIERSQTLTELFTLAQENLKKGILCFPQGETAAR